MSARKKVREYEADPFDSMSADVFSQSVSMDSIDVDAGVEREAPKKSGVSAEAESVQELSELQKSFRARAAAEQRRFDLATDSEYWVCLCFQSREQKEEFLARMKMEHLGDKYMDGRAVFLAAFFAGRFAPRVAMCAPI